MKTNLWGRTILSVYKYLERLTDAIDQLIERQALNSFYYNRGRGSENNCLSVVSRIIEMSERKKVLINLKVLTDNALKGCNPLLANILIDRYMDEDECDIIAIRHNLSKRTFFRRLAQAEEQFCNGLARQGFDEENLKQYLAKEKWIFDTYSKFENDDAENEVV